MRWIEACQLNGALREAIDAAKGGDVFAPVHVIAPSGRAAQSLGRALGGSGGVVNIKLQTIEHFAESLVPKSELLWRLTPEIRRELTRKVAGGAGDALARHASPMLVQSLMRAFASLRGRSDHEIDRIAESSSLADEVVRLYRNFVKLARPFSDSHDVLERAVDHLDSFHEPVVAVVTQPLAAYEVDLFALLHKYGVLTVIAVGAGDERLDMALRTSLWASGEIEATSSRPSQTVQVVEKIAVLPDADAEVRHAVELLLGETENGTTFSQMGLVYGPNVPYATIIEEQLREAGIPFTSPSSNLVRSVVGRFVNGLLHVLADGFSVDAVEAWLATSPIVSIDSTHWCRAARAARVSQGIEQWARLAKYATSDDARRKGLDQPARECVKFVLELHSSTIELPDTWFGWSCWLQSAIDRYLGTTEERRQWPSVEQQQACDVERMLLRLGNLDAFRESVSLEDFAAAVHDELIHTRPQISVANGVFVGSLRETIGRSFGFAVVVGMAEGVVPSASGDDALVSALRVPDEESSADHERRAYLQLLSAAGRVTLLVPRVDQRAQRERRPSPWLLESASVLAGSRVSANELLADPVEWPWLEVVPSFTSAATNSVFAATVHQARLMSMAHGNSCDDANVLAGISVLQARDGNMWSRFDGVVDGIDALRNVTLSPTALEHWAQCPFRFFLRTVLGVAENEEVDPSRAQTSALDRGVLIHRALQIFLEEMPARLAPDQPWANAERDRLHEIADQLTSRSSDEGRSPRGLVGEAECSLLHQQLDMVLDRDIAVRKTFGVVPSGDGVEVEIALNASEQVPVAFRGRIDRIDRSSDAKKILAIDYKTGRADRFPELARDPVASGEKLQLALYARALAAEHPHAQVSALYWFIGDDGDFARHTVLYDDATRDRLQTVISQMTDGVSRGVFFPNPGSEDRGTYQHCRKCPYDSVCVADRGEVRERKTNNQRISEFLLLTEGTQEGFDD